MILSRHNEFVFVKAKKVGHTSVEMALSTICRQPDDIITPIGAIDEAVRREAGILPKD